MFKVKTCFISIVLFMVFSNVFAEALDKVIAVVNEGVITSSELNAELALLRNQMEANKMQLPPEKVLRKQVLQRLIDVDLALQLAKQNNMSIDNAELNAALAKLATDNKISMDQLKEAVEREGMVWGKYREKMRKEVLLARLHQKAVGQEVKVTNQQIEDYLKTAPQNPDQNQVTYQLQDMLIPLPEEPTSEQLQKAQKKAMDILAKVKKRGSFDKIVMEESTFDISLEENDLGMRHLAELPEVFAKVAVKMAVGQVQGPLRTGNGFHLIRLVAQGGDNGKHEILKTHVRHILLKTDASLTNTEASRQVQNLYQQLKAGRDFATLAKQYSLDIVSAAKGGDLGWINPGELVPEVEKAMNKLQPHQVSKPIKSPFGWHLIEVIERKRVNDSETFKREQVRMFLQQRKFAEAIANWQQHIRTSAYVKIMDKELA